jgi:hypothetical protein
VVRAHPRKTMHESVQRSEARSVPMRAKQFRKPEQRNLRGRHDVVAASWPLETNGSNTMARYGLLWLLGVPIPILLLIWMFGGLN